MTGRKLPRDHPSRRNARWTTLLDAVLPAPDPDRLVLITQVGRSGLAQVESSLADVGLSPVVSESRSPMGEQRFQVLVGARQARLAAEAVVGL